MINFKEIKENRLSETFKKKGYVIIKLDDIEPLEYLRNSIIKNISKICKISHPEKNEERISIIFNIYPHESKPNYEKWFKKGKLKSINYPSVPNF